MAFRKIGKGVKGLKKNIEKVTAPPYLNTYIRAGQASPSPPLGLQLNQVL